MNEVTTTRKGFPVYDITHKPKRTQAGNLLAIAEAECESGLVVNESPVSIYTGVPNVITIERAIKFYEENAKGEYAKLYEQTAKWLRELMTKNVSTNVENEVK